jgi:hypothetical protein
LIHPRILNSAFITSAKVGMHSDKIGFLLVEHKDYSAQRIVRYFGIAVWYSGRNISKLYHASVAPIA